MSAPIPPMRPSKRVINEDIKIFRKKKSTKNEDKPEKFRPKEIIRNLPGE